MRARRTARVKGFFGGIRPLRGRVFGDGTVGFGRDAWRGVETQNTGGEDGGDLAAAFVRTQVGVGLVHGRLLSSCAHDDLGLAAGAASGRTVYSLCCLLTPSEFETSDWGPLALR
jgi:hypothetical protein